MLKKLCLTAAIAISYIQAEPTILKEHLVTIHTTDQNGNAKEITIARESDIRCREVPFDGKTLWSGDYVREEVPEFCKKSFFTAAGTLSPMQIHPDVETFGELEVLDFLEEMQDDESMLFIDCRTQEWFEALSIPGALNVPFIYFTEHGKWEKEKQQAMKLFGIIKTNEGYDFSQAKTILFFCNGIWCRQSPQMIEALLTMGYPPVKMKWYRGGLQSWLNVGMTSTRSVK